MEKEDNELVLVEFWLSCGHRHFQGLHELCQPRGLRRHLASNCSTHVLTFA